MATQELSRSLKPRHLAMISIGGIIGAGLFVGSSASIAAIGPAIVVSYLITGTLILLVMRMLGEMAMSLPKVHSFTDFPRAALGPWAGFVTGWLYWYFWMIVVPVEAIAGANILHAWIPLPAGLLGCILMALMTCVNLMSARSYGEFEFWFSSIKVSAIIVFIVLGASYAFGWTSPHGAVSVLAGAVTVYFQLTGAEIITVAAVESAEPARAVAQLTSSVIVRILTFYVGSIFFIVAVVPWNTVRIGESPFTLALVQMHYGWAGAAMDVIILTAVLSCLNSAFYVCSRVLFVLAAHRDAPQALIQLNRRKVPVKSVLLCAFAGVIGILAAVTAPQRVFAFLVDASGALMVFVYMIVAFAQLRLRRKREAAGAPRPALTMWLFPWATYAAIAGMAAVLIAMQFTPSLAQDLHVSLIALGVAILAYFVLRAGRSPGAASASPTEAPLTRRDAFPGIRYRYRRGPDLVRSTVDCVTVPATATERRTLHRLRQLRQFPADACHLQPMAGSAFAHRRHPRLLYRSAAHGAGRRRRAPRGTVVAARRGGLDGHRHLVDALHRHAGLLRAAPHAALQPAHQSGIAVHRDADIAVRAVDLRPPRPVVAAACGELGLHGGRHLRHALHRHGVRADRAGNHLQRAPGRRLRRHRDHGVLCRSVALLPPAQRRVGFNEAGTRRRGRRDGHCDHRNALHGHGRRHAGAGLVLLRRRCGARRQLARRDDRHDRAGRGRSPADHHPLRCPPGVADPARCDAARGAQYQPAARQEPAHPGYRGCRNRMLGVRPRAAADHMDRKRDSLRQGGRSRSA